MKTILSKKQLKVYKLVSGEFEGLPTKVAAELMGISPQAVNRLLKRIEKICPSMFPLLSVQEARVQALLMADHNNYDLANQLGVSLSRVSQIVNSLYAKRPNMIIHQPIKMIRYAPHFDNQIKERF